MTVVQADSNPWKGLFLSSFLHVLPHDHLAGGSTSVPLVPCISNATTFSPMHGCLAGDGFNSSTHMLNVSHTRFQVTIGLRTAPSPLCPDVLDRLSGLMQVALPGSCLKAVQV